MSRTEGGRERLHFNQDQVSSKIVLISPLADAFSAA